jgi:hypothetical protein
MKCGTAGTGEQYSIMSYNKSRKTWDFFMWRFPEREADQGPITHNRPEDQSNDLVRFWS